MELGKMQGDYDVRFAHFARALAGGFAVAFGNLPSEAELLRRIPIAFCRVPNEAAVAGRPPYRAGRSGIAPYRTNGHLVRREWRTLAKTDCGEVSAANVVATLHFAEKSAYDEATCVPLKTLPNV